MKKDKEIRNWYAAYGQYWPDDTAEGFIAWFADRINSIPEPLRSSARIELSAEDGYAAITISYTRPETDDEEAYRMNEEAMNEKRIIADELQSLARLKAKYEQPAEFRVSVCGIDVAPFPVSVGPAKI